MNNVIDQLAELGAPAGQPVPDDVVRGDLVRGRAALRRRRFHRGITGLGASAAVAVVAVAAISGQQSAGTDGSDSSGGLDLVAYHGAQLPGFTVGKVPEGFVLQGSDPYSLAIARPDDHTAINDFRDKLVVMLQSTSMTELPDGKAVQVEGRPATIYKGDPAAAQLYYSDGAGHDIVIQSWSGLGLTDAELVEFARSVTVTSNAEATAG
jgi:hypothetical protein